MTDTLDDSSFCAGSEQRQLCYLTIMCSVPRPNSTVYLQSLVATTYATPTAPESLLVNDPPQQLYVACISTAMVSWAGSIKLAGALPEPETSVDVTLEVMVNNVLLPATAVSITPGPKVTLTDVDVYVPISASGVFEIGPGTYAVSIIMKATVADVDVSLSGALSTLTVRR
jgi:hypothetical protein